MIAKFENWTQENGFLYISKYGLTIKNEIFIELTTIKNSALNLKSDQFISNLINKVNILCIKSGGKHTNENAIQLLNSYHIKT